MIVDQILPIFGVALQIIGLYLLADFVAGIFHWAEDTLGADDTPIWGPLFAEPNSLHHSDPSAMNKNHWLKNNAILFSVAFAIVAIAWALGVLYWQIVVFAVFGGGVHSKLTASLMRQRYDFLNSLYSYRKFVFCKMGGIIGFTIHRRI